MTKSWQEPPLWWRVHLGPNSKVYLHAGRIIGHLGCSGFDFFDQAKLLHFYDKLRFENAVRDLTVYLAREASPPRYELHPQAKKVLRVILGPAPDDPEYADYWKRRLIAVAAARERGIEPEWAVTPPVPLEEAKPREPELTDDQMAAVMREWTDRSLKARLRQALKEVRQLGNNPVVGEGIRRKARLMQAEADRRGLDKKEEPAAPDEAAGGKKKWTRRKKG